MTGVIERMVLQGSGQQRGRYAVARVLGGAEQLVGQLGLLWGRCQAESAESAELLAFWGTAASLKHARIRVRDTY